MRAGRGRSLIASRAPPADISAGPTHHFGLLLLARSGLLQAPKAGMRPDRNMIATQQPYCDSKLCRAPFVPASSAFLYPANQIR